MGGFLRIFLGLGMVLVWGASGIFANSDNLTVRGKIFQRFLSSLIHFERLVIRSVE